MEESAELVREEAVGTARSLFVHDKVGAHHPASLSFETGQIFHMRRQLLHKFQLEEFMTHKLHQEA